MDDFDESVADSSASAALEPTKMQEPQYQQPINPVAGEFFLETADSLKYLVRKVPRLAKKSQLASVVEKIVEAVTVMEETKPLLEDLTNKQTKYLKEIREEELPKIRKAIKEQSKIPAEAIRCDFGVLVSQIQSVQSKQSELGNRIDRMQIEMLQVLEKISVAFRENFEKIVELVEAKREFQEAPTTIVKEEVKLEPNDEPEQTDQTKDESLAHTYVTDYTGESQEQPESFGVDYSLLPETAKPVSIRKPLEEYYRNLNEVAKQKKQR